MALAKLSFQIPSHVYLFLYIQNENFRSSKHLCQMAHFPAKHLAKFTAAWPHICLNAIKWSIKRTQVEMPPCVHCTTHLPIPLSLILLIESVTFPSPLCRQLPHGFSILCHN